MQVVQYGKQLVRMRISLFLTASCVRQLVGLRSISYQNQENFSLVYPVSLLKYPTKAKTKSSREYVIGLWRTIFGSCCIHPPICVSLQLTFYPLGNFCLIVKFLWKPAPASYRTPTRPNESPSLNENACFFLEQTKANFRIFFYHAICRKVK